MRAESVRGLRLGVAHGPVHHLRGEVQKSVGGQGGDVVGDFLGGAPQFVRDDVRLPGSVDQGSQTGVGRLVDRRADHAALVAVGIELHLAAHM